MTHRNALLALAPAHTQNPDPHEPYIIALT